MVCIASGVTMMKSGTWRRGSWH